MTAQTILLILNRRFQNINYYFDFHLADNILNSFLLSKVEEEM